MITIQYEMTDGTQETLTRTKEQHETFQALNNATIHFFFVI